jgi:hypothetical protein
MSTLQKAPIDDLRPTQLTIGKIEVAEKRKILAALSGKDQEKFLESHPMPAVVGPEKELYITDHHHLARAALEAKVTSGCFLVEADLSKLNLQDFWEEMNQQSWVHPLDENGVRHRYASIPRHLKDLVDDVYRSLAGFVRDAGGYEKTKTAFAEFIWADYFRRNVAIEDVRADFHHAVKAALRLARSPLAKRIPGFIDK